MVCCIPRRGCSLSNSQRCSQCQSDQLQWGVSRGQVVADVLLCSLCNHREQIEDWAVPVLPLDDKSCSNCGKMGGDETCRHCGLSREEDQQVHLELRGLISESSDFLSASRAANKMGRRLLALKLATAACIYGEPARKEAARALRVWLLAAIGETNAAHDDATAWVQSCSQPSQLAWGSLGQQCERLELFAEATDAYGKALEADPSQKMIRCRRAKLLLDQNRDGQALAEVRALLETSAPGELPETVFPVVVGVLNQLEKHHNHDECARILGLLGKEVKSSPELLAHAARMNAMAGKSKEAQKQLKMARKLAPDLPIYQRVEKVLGSADGSWRKW